MDDLVLDGQSWDLASFTFPKFSHHSYHNENVSSIAKTSFTATASNPPSPLHFETHHCNRWGEDREGEDEWRDVSLGRKEKTRKAERQVDFGKDSTC